MKLGLIIAGAAVLVIAGLLIGGNLGGSQVDEEAVVREIFDGTGQLVETVADSDVRWIQQLMASWDIANRNYLIWAMPYSLAMVAAGVLGLGLLMAVVVLVRRL